MGDLACRSANGWEPGLLHYKSSTPVASMCIPETIIWPPHKSGYAQLQPPPGTVTLFTQSVLRIPQNADSQYQAIINVISQAGK